MNWLYYLLEANLYLAAFYLLYKLLLQNSTFYNGNRYFLIWSIAAAFTIPLLQLGFLKPQVFVDPELDYYEIPLETLEIKTIEKSSTLTIEDYLVYGYIALAFCLAINFLISIAKIIKIYFGNRKQKSGRYTLVELPTEQSAFSFFNVLFIHPSMAKNDAILTHEKIHIREKHSIDIILLELLKIVCWFNPIVYFIKNDLRLLHEYIADENTTAATISKHEYAMFLIENSIGSFSPSLVNQFFNQSILKSRINMLNKKKTANWARLKYLLAVPLGGALLCVSTLGFSKSYGYVEIGTRKEAKQTNTQQPEEHTDAALLSPTQSTSSNPPEVKKDQIKFPPTYKPKNQKSYVGNFRLDKKTGKPVSKEKQLIIVNGKPIANNDKFYGVKNTESITILNLETSVKKYGKAAKFGAVEITGKDIKYITDIISKPPPPIEPQPARYSPENQQTFYPRNAYNNKKLIKVDKRLIVINGQFIEDNSKFYGVTNADKIVILNAQEATKVYGAKKGKYGAVQISGNVKGTGLVEPPPSLYKSPIEIDRNNGDLLSFSKVSEVKALTVYDRWGKVIYNNSNYNDDWNTKQGNYENYDGKELASGTYYYFVKVNEAPEKSMRGWFSIKGQGLKVTPNDALNKTGATKKADSQSATGKSEVTTAKSTFEKANNAFTKAWTLYKPKVQENSNDGC